MSYCRFGPDSDVYAYPAIKVPFVVHLPYDRGIYKGATIYPPTLQELKETLLELQKSGYKVPDYALERIEEELSWGGD